MTGWMTEPRLFTGARWVGGWVGRGPVRYGNRLEVVHAGRRNSLFTRSFLPISAFVLIQNGLYHSDPEIR